MTSYSKQRTGTSRIPPEKDLQVLYEDNHLIAVFKPAGLLTQGDSSGDISLMDVTKAWLKDKYGKPGQVFLGLVHRLDRSVSGIVLFGKTSKGASRLSEQFRTRSVQKIYWAVVEGNVSAPRGPLVHYLGGDGSRGVTVSETEVPGLKKAILNYSVLKTFPSKTLLEVELGTGRKHQIRAQLGFIRHPIVGDAKYGAKTAFSEGAIALVAKRLVFHHPVRAEEQITIELPDELCGGIS